MKSLLTGIATAAVIALTAMSAQATTTFNLGGSLALQPSLNYSEDGINLNVGGGTFSSSTYGSETVSGGAWVNRDGNGIGVSSGVIENPEVDGNAGNDVAVFSFDQAVKLVSVSFSKYDDETRTELVWSCGRFGCIPTGIQQVPAPDDEFSFLADTDNNNSLNMISTNLDGNPYVFAQDWIGDLFGIGAWDSNDDFRIKSIEVSAVPLPAALPLYGAGLAVMGFAGWRKRRKAAAQA